MIGHKLSFINKYFSNQLLIITETTRGAFFLAQNIISIILDIILPLHNLYKGNTQEKFCNGTI
jgi:hypothetical protein